MRATREESSRLTLWLLPHMMILSASSEAWPSTRLILRHFMAAREAALSNLYTPQSCPRVIYIHVTPHSGAALQFGPNYRLLRLFQRNTNTQGEKRVVRQHIFNSLLIWSTAIWLIARVMWIKNTRFLTWKSSQWILFLIYVRTYILILKSLSPQERNLKKGIKIIVLARLNI